MYLIYLLIFIYRILEREIDLLNNNFESSAAQLQQNLLRVRKTVKFRTAIPVVEIYVC